MTLVYIAMFMQESINLTFLYPYAGGVQQVGGPCVKHKTLIKGLPSSFTLDLSNKANVELLGRPFINILCFAHGPPTCWTPPAFGISWLD